MWSKDYYGVNFFLKYVDSNLKNAFCNFNTFFPIIIFISPRGSYGKEFCNFERAVEILRRIFYY
jgi:hypothetical protein